MTHRIPAGRAAAALAATTLLVAGVAPLASAKDAEVRASGTCSAGATWTLKAKQDDRRLQVELEVDSNVVGQTWAWRLRDNGVSVASGTARTVAPSGSFEVTRRVVDRSGDDVLVATATHGTQTCRARVVFPG